MTRFQAAEPNGVAVQQLEVLVRTAIFRSANQVIGRLEGSCTPALARLICLEGADEPSFHKAQQHLKETGGIAISGRQIQRMVQHVGPGAQTWQEREIFSGLQVVFS